MFPFDAILFDVGGVLLTNGWDHRERAIVLDQFHLDRGDFEARHTTSNDAWERDAITAKEYLDATVFYQPRSFSPDEFLAAVCAQSKPLEDGALGILAELSASDNCMLGVLNNEARETNDYRFSTYGLRDHLRVAFSSCYLGLRKPEPAIYHRALDILGKPAARILFIDDRAENAEAAAAAGMKTIRFQGAAALRRELANFEVL
ncbi:MAG TPA: HAD-IA family hydrolase [Terracidiphilus sp.]|jgi:putative hydrolase of the HAD superfamily|nr:HAD-IA family hydrolase [Terracidiphilus sp.]